MKNNSFFKKVLTIVASFAMLFAGIAFVVPKNEGKVYATGSHLYYQYDDDDQAYKWSGQLASYATGDAIDTINNDYEESVYVYLNDVLYKTIASGGVMDIEDKYTFGATAHRSCVADGTRVDIYDYTSVLYNANASTDTVTGIPTDSTKYGKDATDTTLSQATPIRAGYKFVGWNTNPAATTAIELQDDKFVFGADKTSDFTLYAIWQAKTSVSLLVSAQSYVFDGEGQEFELKGTHESLGGYTLQYRINGSSSEFSSTLPVKAGNYDVKITRNETDDYKAYEHTIPNGLQITKAVLTDNTTSYSKVYNGNPVTKDDILNHLSIVGFKGSDTILNNRVVASDVVKYTKNAFQKVDYNNQIVNAGTYKIGYIFYFENYEKITKEIFVTVSKAKYNMSGITFENSSIDYDGQAHNYVISGTLPTGADNVKLAVSYDKTSMIDAGEYVVTATFHPTINYETPTAKTATFTITKATNVISDFAITNADSENKIDLGEIINPTATSTFGEIVYAYKALSGDKYYTVLNVANEVYPKVAGKYYLRASVKGTNNYSSVEKIINFEIKSIEIQNKAVEESEKVLKEQKVELIKGTIDTSYLAVFKKNDSALSEQAISNIQNKFLEKTEVISKFSIHIETQFGVVVQNLTGNTYKVSLKLTDELKGKNGYCIVYIDDNNKVEKYSTTLTNGDTVSFETDHFSNWVLVANIYEEKKADNNWIWIVCVISVVLLIAAAAVVLILTKKKLIFIVKDKVIKDQTYKFGQKITLDDELKKYSWFSDKTMKKPFNRQTAGLLCTKVYGKIKQTENKEK